MQIAKKCGLRILLSTFFMMMVSCGAKTPPASVSDETSQVREEFESLESEVSFDGASVDSGPAELIAITPSQAEQGSIVTLVGNKEMSPNIFQLTEPEQRIIVDLPNTKLGSIDSLVEVNDQRISKIRIEQIDESTSPLARVEIFLTSASGYQVVSEGNNLSLQIGDFAAQDNFGNELAQSFGVASETNEFDSGDQFFSVDEDSGIGSNLDALSQSDAELNEITDFQDPLAASQSSATFDQTVGSLGVTSQEAAKNLIDINYGISEEGTIVSILGDGNVENYEHFILENPKRVVLDLPGLSSQYKGSNSVLIDTAEVKEVRVGQENGKTRVVLDLAKNDQVQYMVDPLNSTVMITIPSASAIAKMSKPAQPEPVTQVAQLDPGNLQADLQDDTSFSPSFEPLEDSSFGLNEDSGSLDQNLSAQVPAFDSAPDNSKTPPASSVQAVVFKQLPDQKRSQFRITTTNPDTVYDIVESADGIGLIVRNSKLGSSILKRHFDTSEFASAVEKITPNYDRTANDTTFDVALSQNVNYQSYKEGSDIVLEVDIPQTLVAQNQSSPSSGISGGASPSGQELMLDATSLGESISQNNKSIGIGVEEQSLGLAPAPKKDYSYVNESFMSDSLDDDTPLSQMGAILAGQLDGRQFTGRKISLDFKDADIRSIFRLISDISKFNLIISDEVSGRVTIRLDDVPWDQAFAIILQSKGLWFEKYGNIVRVAQAKKLQEEKEAAAAAERASQAVKPLDILFKPVSFAQAATLTKQVGTILSERGSVDIDSRTNTLIIKDIRENLEKARKMVDILDTQTPQVSIEARIVEATTTFTRSFGITWTGNTRFTAATGNPTGLYFPNSVAVTPFALNFPVDGGFINSTANVKLGSINNVVDLDLALAIGEQKGYSKLISAPKVTVLDNKQATITAGSRIPFLTQTANAGSNVRFENAATSLSVTPHITNDGSILMDITATRNEPNFAQLVQGNPLIDQRTAITEVLVKSGNTTVLGGIYSTRTGRSISRFPFLSSIPIVGALFRNYDKQLSRTELLIFVTPRIVGDEREAIRDVRE